MVINIFKYLKPKEEEKEIEKFNEIEFQKAYKEMATKIGLNLDPDDPLHYYDWRALYKETGKLEPDEEGHFSSKYKLEGHPRVVVGGIDTKTGKSVSGGGGGAGAISKEENKEIDISKYIIPKGEVKAGAGVKAEETKKEEPNVFDTLNESIEKNYKQYQSMTKKLEAYQAEYDYAPDNIKPSIAANFNKLVKQHGDLIKQLESDIAKRDSIISTKYKVAFSKYKQLTGLPEEKGISAPTRPATPYKPIIEGLPISPGEKPKPLFQDEKMMELHKINFESFKLWFKELKESKDKIAFFKGEGQSPELKELRKQYKEKAPYMYEKSEQWIENVSMISVGIGMAYQLVNAAVTSGFKVKDKVISAKELREVLERARAAYVPETGKFKATLSNNDYTVMKQLNVFFKTSGRGTAAREMFEKIVEKTGGLSFPQQVNIFGGKLYAGVPIDEMVKSIVAVGRLTQDIANQLKVMNPVDTGLVFQQLSMVAPAIAAKVASQFVDLIPQKITKIPKAGEEMTPEELEQFEKLKEAKIIPEKEIEPTKAELKEIEAPIGKEKFEEAFRIAKMKEAAAKIKPIEEPEKFEPEPTPEEIRTVFMDKENLETTVKNREYFLGKFGKLFTETKKAEDTLIKQKYNEMQSMLEYEEDEIYRLAFGKDKMRIPETTKTEWMEGLDKGKYIQIFRTDKNLQYPDEIASNLGISENELREQIIERIRTAPKEVTLESAKQDLIDEGSSVFMQVTAQMDAYKILLDEIEGGEYSFDTPQNVKRLNAKISALKSDSKKLMDEYEEKITEIQKKGIEEKFEELKKGLEAREKIGIEIGIKKGLKIAKAELKGKKFKDMTKEEIKEGSKLIKQIQVMVKDRGFTKKQFSDIKMTHGEARSLSSKTKRMTIPQLKAVLKAVEAARPHRIGYRKVITPKTEKKIQSLKDNLIDKLQMTEESYQAVLKDVGVYKEPKYIDAKSFITEEKGKELIYRLIDESNILRVTEPLRIALEKNPEAKKIADGIDKRIKLEGKERLKDPHELNSMRKYIQIMEATTDAPFFPIYQDLIDAHLENRADLNHLVSEFDEYRDIIKNEDALKRVESWILAKSNLKGVPEVSKDITDGEITLAKKIQGILKDYETKARTEKFLDNIEHLEDMPQYIQYRKEINKAKDIYESKGYDDLVEYMKTQEWGVIKNSYDPLQVVSPKIRLYKAKATTLGKSHIKVRKDIEYKEQDKNIIQRLLSYKRQMDNLSVMRLKIRAFVTLVDKNLDKFKDPNRIRTNIEVFFRELKGYDRPENWFDRGINRLYAQAMTTIIMGSPALSFRNLGQNFGLGHDKAMLIDHRNKHLTPDEIDYLDTYVQQAEFMRVDWFMTGEKPLPGLKFLTDIIKKVNLYPRSDIANRHWGFWAKINQVKMAFDKNVSLAKKMEEAKFSDMTLLEQKRALQILSKDGQEAMEKYVTRVYVDDTHFLYERAQRSPAEMGRVGRVFGNLMLFPRAYWEKLAQHSKKMTGKNVPFKERLRAFKVIASVLIGGMLISAAYKKTTGRIKSPYDPLELLAYAPGGLMISTVGTVSDVYIDFILAAKGDEKAMADLTTSLPALADMFIPFYNYTLRGIEAFVVDEKGEGGKNIDRLALRKLRMLIDKEYQVRGGAYKLERNAMEKWQYFLSGAGIDVTIKEREKEIKGKRTVKRISIKQKSVKRSVKRP